MKKPDFFILGAPKCGTTSLAEWLREHPRIFMCDPKEPHYFNTDSGHHAALSLPHYESFFVDADSSHLAVGEASVWYLVSDVAVGNILAYQPHARFIVCIRNPIEMAVSLHDQKRFTGDEPIADFLEAWRAQEGRRNGTLPKPKVCADLKHFMYGTSCLLGSQLKRLYSQVDTERVMVVVMDDIKSEPSGVYSHVLNFLGVPDDGRSDFPPSNRAKERRFPWVRTVQRRVHLAKGQLGITSGTGLGRIINTWNRRQRPRAPLPTETLQILRAYFRDDINLCGELLQRNLSSWLQDADSSQRRS